jgi:hypothetical protein
LKKEQNMKLLHEKVLKTRTCKRRNEYTDETCGGRKEEKKHELENCERDERKYFLFIFFGGLECVGHSFAYGADLYF